MLDIAWKRDKEFNSLRESYEILAFRPAQAKKNNPHFSFVGCTLTNVRCKINNPSTVSIPDDASGTSNSRIPLLDPSVLSFSQSSNGLSHSIRRSSLFACVAWLLFEFTSSTSFTNLPISTQGSRCPRWPLKILLFLQHHIFQMATPKGRVQYPPSSP